MEGSLSRRAWFAALLAAPLAAAAAVHAKPVDPKFCITLRCDASEFIAAMERMCKRLEAITPKPTWEDVRAQMDGMPPIKITLDDKVIDEVYIAL